MGHRHLIAPALVVLYGLGGLSTSACWDDPERGKNWLLEDVQDEGTGVIVVQPGSLAFGFVCEGSYAERTLTLRNDGDGAFTLETAALDPDPGDAFLVLVPTGGETIAPGESVDLTVAYAPVAPGPVSAQLHFSATSADVLPVDVSLTGSEGGPDLELDPGLLDFGPVAVGDTRLRTLQISSVGDLPLLVLGIDLEPTLPPDELWIDALSTGTYPSTIEAGDAIEVTLALRPLAYQPYDASPLAHLTLGSSECSGASIQVPIHGWPGGVSDDCVPMMEEGHLGKPIEDVDVLFVVDNSASMEEEQASMATHFASFMTYADGLGIDYQIGVTTTDVEAHEGALLGDPSLVTPAEAESFLTNVLVGIGGSDSEKGLAASQLALEGASAAFMGGHLRASANLAIIYVSDDEDHSQMDAGTFGSSFLPGLKAGSSASVKAHAFVARPPGCVEESENFGTRYIEVAQATGGTITSICDTVFEDAFTDIGLACFGDAASFHLERPADPGTVEVLVNGVPCEESWTMSPHVQTVIFDFDSPCFPSEGTPVVIRYVPLCWQG
jgi:hypothetical protein